MEIHRSPKRMVTGEPWAASTCSQIASCAAKVVSRCPGQGAHHRSPRWTLAQQRCRSRHQEGRSMREGGKTPEGPRRIGKNRRPGGRCHQDIFEEGTGGCAGTPNPRVGEGMQGVHGLVHQENLQAASGIGCGGSPSSGEPCVSGEVGGTASSNTSRLRPTLAKLGLDKTNLGQTRFCQNQVRPNELWPRPSLARPTGLCTCCDPDRPDPDPNLGRPPRDRPKFRTSSSLSRHNLHYFFLSCGLLVEVWWCF